MGRIDASFATSRQTVNRYDAPAAALRRLNLPLPNADSFLDIVQLNASELQRTLARIDDEYEVAERTNLQTSAAYEALGNVEAKLQEISTILDTNTRAGISPYTRRDNQKKIDQLIKEIGEIFRDTRSEGTPLFDGKLELTAGSQSIRIEQMSLDRLGKIFVNGRSLSLEDLKSGGRLDTDRQSRQVAIAATRSVRTALKTVTGLRQRLKDFSQGAVVPRLADFAELIAGLTQTVSTDTIGSSQEAMEVLREIRLMTMQATGVAAAVGAEDWDQERVIQLLS